MILFPPKRAYLLILFLISCLIVLSASTCRVQADAQIRVYGRIIDANNGFPISGARIIFYDYQVYGRSGLVIETNSSGSYEAWVPQNSYDVYAYCDYPSTPGLDYVPAQRRVRVREMSLNVSFALLSGASVNMLGELSFFDLPLGRSVVFRVIDPSGLLHKTDSVTEYGDAFHDRDLLNLSSRTVVVPSNTLVKVEVDAVYMDGSEWHSTIDDLNLTQGDQLSVNPHHVMLKPIIFDYTSAHLQSAQVMVDKAEAAGFYVYYEKIKLSRAGKLVESAQSSFVEKDYDGAYADLYEAYLIAKGVEGSLQSSYVNAPWSVFFITPLLSFTALAVASILWEGRRRRLALSLALYGVLFGLLYLLFPGYTTLQKSVFNPWADTTFEAFFISMLAAVSFLLPLFVMYGLPFVFGKRPSKYGLCTLDAAAAAFSVAGRNLRRRKLRTFLTSTLLFTSVFALIVLTSLSLEQGFAIQLQPGQVPTNGFLLRRPLVGERMPFRALKIDILQWLRERPEVVLVAPKMVNTPRVGRWGPPPPLATLCVSESGLSFDIRGVLGVYPSFEAEVTKIDGIVVQGAFLSDGDLSGILLSEEAAEELQVEPNDTLQLYGRTFNVTGIFDSKKLEGLKDLDGASLLPQQVTAIPGDTTYDIEYVPSKEVIIIHGETAHYLPEMMVSRVDVQTRSPREIIDFARMAVLNWPGVEAFISLDRKIQRLFIGEYYMASGFASTMVPLALVVLNVGVTVYGEVHDRKGETAVMSLVGLNPSHIGTVFVAQALLIGVVAGSLGYLFGLTSYRFMALFAPFGVKQKVEAIWGVLALGFSIAASVLSSTLPAYKASMIATPSLLRRWEMEEMPPTKERPWILRMPIYVREENLENVIIYLYERLSEYARYAVFEWVENLKIFGAEPRIFFTYCQSDQNVTTDNQLVPVETEVPHRYTFQLHSISRQPGVGVYIRITANFVRRLFLQYSYDRSKGTSPRANIGRSKDLTTI